MCSFFDLVSAATAATRDSCKGEVRLVVAETTTDDGVLAGLEVGEDEVPSVGIAVDVPTLWTTIAIQIRFALFRATQSLSTAKAWLRRVFYS